MIRKLKALFSSEPFASIFVLGIFSAMAYLPLIYELGYSHDDWYLMYAGQVRGTSVFFDIFSGDRPLRALVMIPSYWAFGSNPLYYNLSTYFFRLLSGIGFLWALRLFWPKERSATLLMAILFLIYPGFLSQPNGIDYQAHLVSLASATFSIALTLKAILTEKKSARIIFFALSIFLGWFYLGLMEYYLGIEALRLLLILALSLREKGSFSSKMMTAIRRGAAFLLISVPFIIWRFFIFESERGATDMGKQLTGFLSDPFAQSLVWISHLYEDSVAVLFGAWITPFSQLYQRDFKLLSGTKMFLIFLVVTAIIYQLYYFLKQKKKPSKEGTSWQIEALWIGFFSMVICQLPIILVNRQVSFPTYSRYTLPGSLGAVMVLVALLYTFREKYIRLILFSMLITIAILTHKANTKKFVTETESMNEFWWQVSWRIPHLGERTTLVVNYPRVATEEDYFIWGPANQIYYPNGTNERVVQPGVYAVVLNDESVEKIIAKERQEFGYRRGIETYANYRNILILTQPTSGSCVQIIDGFQPEYSKWEIERIKQVGAFSEVEHILPDANFHTPPEIVFGLEPAHNWCYIYQKATLARQIGDWNAVALFDRQASQNAFVPQDAVEWLPFVQAAAMLGDAERVQEIALFLKNEPYILEQACDSLRGMEITPEMRTLAEDSYCIEE